MVRHKFGWLFFLIVFFSIPAFGQDAKTEDTLTLSEVEVYGKRVPIFPVTPLIMKDYNYEAIHDLGDFLRQEPNVSGIRKGGVAIDPVVRGFKYNQVTVLLNNGVKIEGGCPNRMDPVVSHVENDDIRQVDIVKGPYVLKYGPVMGALINIQTFQPEQYERPSIHGKIIYGFETNWNGQHEHLELRGGNRIISFRASGGVKGYGSYRAGNGELFHTSFQKAYASVAAGVRIKKNQTLTLSYLYNQGTNVQFPALPMDERLDQTQNITINYQAGNLRKILSSLQVQGYLSPVHHVMDNYDRSSSQTMKALTTVDAFDAGGNVTAAWKWGKSEWMAGMDFEHIYKDGEKMMTMKMVMSGDTFTSVKYFNVFNKSVWNNGGIFGEFQTRFGDVGFIAALRMDYNQANSADTFRLVKDGVAYFDLLGSDFVNISFNLGAKKSLAPDLFITAALGMGTRSPSILERFIKLMPVLYDSYDYLGNPQLRPEQNIQFDVSFDYKLTEIGSFFVNGFFSLVNQYIVGKVIPPSVIKPSTQGVLGVKQFSNVDQVWLTGFECSFRSPDEKKWGIRATAAATYGTNPKATRYLITAGAVTGEELVKNDPLPEIPPLEGTLQVYYKFLKSSLVPRLTTRFVAAQNRVSEAYGEEATPGFVTVAFAMNYTPCNYFSISAGVENIFDNAYYEHLNRRMVGSNEKLFEPGRVFYVTLMAKF